MRCLTRYATYALPCCCSGYASWALLLQRVLLCAAFSRRYASMRCLAVAAGMPVGLCCCSGSSYALPSHGLPCCCSGYARAGSAVAAGPPHEGMPLCAALLLQRVCQGGPCWCSGSGHIYALPCCCSGYAKTPRAAAVSGRSCCCSGPCCSLRCCSGCQHHSPHRGVPWAQRGSLLQRPPRAALLVQRAARICCCSGSAPLSRSRISEFEVPTQMRGTGGILGTCTVLTALTSRHAAVTRQAVGVGPMHGA